MALDPKLRETLGHGESRGYADPAVSPAAGAPGAVPGGEAPEPTPAGCADLTPETETAAPAPYGEEAAGTAGGADQTPEPETTVPAPYEAEAAGTAGGADQTPAPEASAPAPEEPAGAADPSGAGPGPGEVSTAESIRILTECVSALARQTDALEEAVSRISSGMEEAVSRLSSDLEETKRGICERQEGNARKLAQTLRENASFQVQVREGMQKELEGLRKVQTGELFDPILKEIAKLYSDYYTLQEDESLSERAVKTLGMMFEQIAEILEDYGAEIFSSTPGERRRPRLCRIIGKIPTGEKEKHDTVLKSRRPGVMKGRMVLSEEYVDIYIYDETLAAGTQGTEAEAPQDAAAGSKETGTPEQTAAGQGTDYAEDNAQS